VRDFLGRWHANGLEQKGSNRVTDATVVNPSPCPPFKGGVIRLNRVGHDLPHPCQALRGENLRRHPNVAGHGNAVPYRSTAMLRRGPLAANFRTLVDNLPATRQIFRSFDAAHPPLTMVRQKEATEETAGARLHTVAKQAVGIQQRRPGPGSQVVRSF